MRKVSVPRWYYHLYFKRCKKDWRRGIGRISEELNEQYLRSINAELTFYVGDIVKPICFSPTPEGLLFRRWKRAISIFYPLHETVPEGFIFYCDDLPNVVIRANRLRRELEKLQLMRS